MQTWQMQEAKARLSELVKLAQSEGPQDITLHGRSVAVVLSRSAFERLSGSALGRPLPVHPSVMPSSFIHRPATRMIAG